MSSTCIPAPQATLGDDGNLTNGISQLSTTNSAFATTIFKSPTSSLAIDTVGGSTVVQLSQMDNGYNTPTTTFSGASGDTFRFVSNVGLPGTDVNLNGATTSLNLNGLSPTVGALSGNGTVTNSSTTTAVLTVAGTGTFSGVIQNGASTELTGLAVASGAETLSGANTYTGPTSVAGGTLRLGANSALPGTSSVTVSAGGTFDLNGFNQTILNVYGTGTITNNSAAASTSTLTINSGGLFGGAIQNGGATMVTALTVNGGTLILAGDNTYTGATNVVAGTLRVGSGTPPSGAAAHYTFDGNTNDSSGNGNNGTLTGSGASYVSGQLGQALDLTGSQSVSVPYSASLANLHSFTVSAWVNLVGNFASFTNGIVGTRFGGDETFDVKVQSSGIHGDVGSGTGWINTSVDLNNAQGGLLTANTWAMVTYVIDNAAQQFRIYVNGNLLNTIGFSGTPLFMSPGETMNIGEDYAGEYMHGGIDDVYIYPTALSTTQVSSLYASTFVTGTINAIPDLSPVTVAAGATLDLNGSNETIGSLAGAGSVLLGTGGGLNTGGNNTSTTFTGVISGTATLGVTKSGSGTMILSGPDTYTGSTIIIGGILSISSDGNLGTAPGSATPGSIVINGGTLQATATFALNSNRGIALGPTSGSGGGAIDVTGANTLTYAGIVANNGSSAGTLTKTDTGTLVLGGPDTFTGLTTISAGTLKLGNASALTSASSVTDNAILDLGGFSDSVDALNGSGAVINSGTLATLMVTGGGTFSGNITGASTGLTVAGTTQTLTLSGNDTYSGLTTINSGDILKAGSTTAFSVNSNVSDGGTLDLGGFSNSIDALSGNGAVINTGLPWRR